jgi:hypothetical protein
MFQFIKGTGVSSSNVIVPSLVEGSNNSTIQVDAPKMVNPNFVKVYIHERADAS